MDKKLDIILQRTENIEELTKKVDQIDNKLISNSNELDQFCNLVKNIEQKAIDNEAKLMQYKSTIDKLLSKDTIHDKETRAQQHELNKMSEMYKQLKIEVNKKNQYDRSNYNILMGGVPLIHDNESAEETQELVCKIAKNAKLPKFAESDIDVAHRLPSRNNNNNPMIIIRFKYKSARQRFFSGRQVFKKLSAAKLLAEDDEVQINYAAAAGNPLDAGKIFLTESLSELNGELLRQAKELAKPLGYKFFGYTVGGEVRVKKAESSRFIAIKYYDDLAKIV